MANANPIRKARLEAGLTQEDLAREVGVGLRNVPDWESGRRIPRLKTLRRIAEATGVSVEDLTAEEQAVA